MKYLLTLALTATTTYVFYGLVSIVAVLAKHAKPGRKPFEL